MISPPTGDIAWQPYVAAAAGFEDLATRVHVWRVGLDGVSGAIDDNLSDDEKARADRFRRPEDRRRFVAARGVLRTILADVLGLDDRPRGQRLRLGCGPAGKPFLVGTPGLHFNVSHSEDLALIAVTRSGEVGVDVERQRGMSDMGAIARLLFSEAERAAMLGCPPDTRETVFYRIWTRKEAILKAMGGGLTALDDPDAASHAHARTAWHVTMLPHLDGYAAALARPRGAHGMRLWSWPGTTALRSVERRARPRAPSQGSPTALLPFEARR